MASSQNSKEATHRPVTWGRRRIYISPKQMGEGGGRRQISVKTSALSKMCFFCFSLYPSAFLADGTCIICPLPNIITLPFIHFPPVATESTSGRPCRWRWGGLWAGHLRGPGVSVAPPSWLVIWAWGWGKRPEKGEKRACFAEGRCWSLSFFTAPQSNGSQTLTAHEIVRRAF